MLAEFAIIPVGAGESLGDSIAGVVRLVDESGLPYRVSAMGTIIEGEWDEVMALIRKCHDMVLEEAPRAVSHISIDIRPSRPMDRLTEKLKSVETRLGKELKG
ncbi:MAG: MTH1187 family thiamine-binding protein [Thermodesulfobacteriota bacterium]|nr:MAG: MTH1187 family thiamine-binding protein [Thermodesulfobacteriota bacterium]